MIRIERPEFRRRCNVCHSLEGAKEIHFLDGNGSGTVICLCAGCMKELGKEIERHWEPPVVHGKKERNACPVCGEAVAGFLKCCPACGNVLVKAQERNGDNG